MTRSLRPPTIERSSRAVPEASSTSGFTFHWNDFLRPLVYLTGPNVRTMAIGLRAFRSENTLAWNYLMAASLVFLVPLLITYYFAQRHLIGGIASFGLKG